jgi:hypothetical protein
MDYEIGGRRSVAIDHARVEDREDVRVLEPGGKLDLAEEALHSLAASELGSHHLQRHQALVAQVASEIHGGHATRTQLPLHDIAVAESSCQAIEVVVHREGNLPHEVGLQESRRS